MFAHQCFKTAPPFQSEEYLAFQMENDPSTASLLQFFNLADFSYPEAVAKSREDFFVLDVDESSCPNLKGDVETLEVVSLDSGGKLLVHLSLP